jgi:hypothetical protein
VPAGLVRAHIQLARAKEEYGAAADVFQENVKKSARRLKDCPCGLRNQTNDLL